MQIYIQNGNYTIASRALPDDDSQFSVKIKQGKREVAKYIIHASELPLMEQAFVTFHEKADAAGEVAFHRYQNQQCSN
jgi:hypothetical protein